MLWTCMCGWTNWTITKRCANCGGSRDLRTKLFRPPHFTRRIVRIQGLWLFAIGVCVPFILAVLIIALLVAIIMSLEAMRHWLYT